ncbi:hypothetical protein PPYR_07814 [Photinus pyralis]|uniref:Sas10 C-terminal domain-containing protein n=1 Tax=Photinus pyralis TaxID=7054 RepID=A0A5N4ARI3_PHOPY|nr:something about silencing protein 10 [Photinus pyralis]KAB0799934.1 hypothetical protein PPYR_07814 [Photinus pyralis]
MSSKQARKDAEDDDDFQYEPSDSDDDYTSQERELIGEVLSKNAEESDSEVEVYGVRSSSDDSDIALSDVEGQEEDDLPNVRAWGKDKRDFYSTDYVDQDYGGFQGQDAALADFEEEEARNLQKQLLEQMDEDDFAFDVTAKSTKADDRQAEEVVKTDISKLSKRQKIELFHKESPEFFGLVEDFKSKMQIVADFLSPLLVLSRQGRVQESNALQFVKVYHEVITNYCTNINMYLLLKASRVNVQNHPVIKRLYQFRKLLAQLDPIFEEVIKSQIETIIKNNENSENVQPKKVLKLLRKLGKKSKRSEPMDETCKELKKPKVQDAEEEKVEENAEAVEENGDMNQEEDPRRAITYQIAKNKGLTPHRNKLQRNPRVKNRDKYRKALIRRKGAVRQVRTEVSRYGGELSGIKASVSKSVKIKS